MAKGYCVHTTAMLRTSDKKRRPSRLDRRFVESDSYGRGLAAGWRSVALDRKEGALYGNPVRGHLQLP